MSDKSTVRHLKDLANIADKQTEALIKIFDNLDEIYRRLKVLEEKSQRMNRTKIINILYDVHCRSDYSIEELADMLLSNE